MNRLLLFVFFWEGEKFTVSTNVEHLQFNIVCNRSYNSSEVKLPLPSNNPLILACDIMLSQKANSTWPFIIQL